MSVVRHLLGAIVRAFFRMVVTGVICAILAASIAFGVAAYNGIHQWPPSHLTDAVIIAIGVLAGYAGALTVLLFESAHAVVAALTVAEHEAFSAGNLIEHGVKAVERARNE